MPSKLVVGHQKNSAEIAAALKTHGPAIAAAVRAVTHAESPKHAVDVGPLLDHVQRVSSSSLAALEEADTAYQLELGDDEAPRRQRDEAAAQLYAAVVQLKESTATLFGASWVAKLTFPRVVPQDPSQLKRAAEQVLEALGSHKLPKPQLAGVGTIDASAWRAMVQEPLTALTAALKAVKTEESEALAARAKRDAALTALVAANVDAAQLAQVLARIGRVSHLIEGLRGTLDTTSAASASEGEPAPTPSEGAISHVG